MADIKQYNILGIVAIIGALLMIIGVFLSWAEMSFIGFSESASGWDIATDSDGEVGYWYAPIVALVCGVISLIAMIFPMIMPAKNIGKALGALGLILAVVTIIVTVLYYNDLGSISSDYFSFGAGAGVWVVIVGAVITIIGAILDFAKKAPAEN